ncbi:AMP-binding protein [Cupriavidus necator]|uniref:AMP-binding protein n=1 Tax=Cupriavidus necator TaxID=106590 RepID=A0A1U9UPK0_CUPNE|nr:AMP-binding protein [Cupriavidus necator]AQV94085.1 AMP-binding protein [Cupriavidus necator]
MREIEQRMAHLSANHGLMSSIRVEGAPTGTNLQSEIGADALSHVRGDTDVALSSQTIPQFLAQTVQKFPDRLAVVFREQDIRWTWREFSQEVDVFATALLGIGLKQGDRIGICSPNRVEWLVTQFATARLGLILVNINPAYGASEFEYAMNKVGCRAIVTAERFKASDYLQMLQTLAPELTSHRSGSLDSKRLPSLRSIIRTGDSDTPGMFGYNALMAAARTVVDTEALDAVSATLDPHDAINIQFTSGTTGSPKGATLSHYNIVNNARHIGMAMRFTEQDSLCIPVPLYHCFGMVIGVLACISAGASMVFPSESFDPATTLSSIEAERCTALHGVPTMFIAQLNHPDFEQYDLSSLRTGMMAGSPCPIETMKDVIEKMHMPEITIGYGMTETSPISFQTTPTDPIDQRVETVGRIQPHLEVKLIAADGSTVCVGEIGELCTRGYAVMKGYWQDEMKTSETLVDGWMRTGDLATIDANGYCRIVGRAKDMLIRGGENVYPREIEEFLFCHPKIESVQVFGVPDKKYGEEACAWIIAKAGEEIDEADIREYCEGNISYFKVPKYIRFVREFPMTVTGKVQKFSMRDQMIEELKELRS